jgi:UPF0042 nucleotide-binding protein
LRPLSGLDPAVGAYIEADPGFAPFLDRLTALLVPLLPRYDREGKSYLTIAIGCTGGQHRSVYAAERLAGWLRAQGKPVGAVGHRDLVQRPASQHATELGQDAGSSPRGPSPAPGRGEKPGALKDPA